MTGLLIVDDEEGIRQSIQLTLEQDGYRLFTAEDGQRAVELVREDPAAISIVISDLRMPGMDGLETLTAIGDINPEICRIMLTGYATLESAIQATNEGIDGFLTKPFDTTELQHNVREFFITKSLKRFVSPQVRDQLRQDPSRIAPCRQKVSILYTDIRGFTHLSEQVGPEELRTLLEENYFTPLSSEIAFQHNGTLDKYIGDSIMVIYGAPVSYGDDERRAVFTALDMRAQMVLINEKLVAQDRSPLPFVVSIATGEAVAGMFGSTHKREYSVLGFTVNMAAHLEVITEANQILIDEATYQAVQDSVRVEKLDPVHPKGVSDPVQVYNVLEAR